MKQILLIILLSVSATSPTWAQEIFNNVLERADKIVNSPTSNFTNTRINQFKSTGLRYIRKKAFETMNPVTDRFLDVQAYYMSEFLTLFFKEILSDKKLSDEKKKNKILMFMDASCSNPLFNDSDKETINAYINEGNELTPFCLDTDWEKAYAAAQAQLKNK